MDDDHTGSTVLTNPGSDDRQPDHPDEQAELRERADGANEPNTSGSDNLREDDTAPGVDPDEGEA